MSADSGTFQQTAWLFTRGQESVYAELRSLHDGLELVVNGPGQAQASYRFAELAAVDTFRARQEQELTAQGFRLQAVAERRNAQRGTSQPETERRRS